METVEHARQQTYPNVEHIIVSDGEDDVLMDMGAEDVAEWCNVPRIGYPADGLDGYPTRWYALGRHWSGLLSRHAIGVAPILAGLLLARGEYLAWLCDDERFVTPDALSLLVEHLERTGVDFAYPKVRMWWNGTTPEQGWDIGTDPPQYGQFTWCLFRADLLLKAMPRFDAPTFNDADLMTRWIEKGASWSFLPHTLVTHRADR